MTAREVLEARNKADVESFRTSEGYSR